MGFLDSQSQDNIGVAPLKHKGRLHTLAEDRAKILSDQFKSVYTKDHDSVDKDAAPFGPNYPAMAQFAITEAGVLKLLRSVNPSKASGPDRIPCRRSQQVIVDGVASQSESVDSGVPQGTVLGPLLFLLFVGDIGIGVGTGAGVRLFAGDCLIYRPIRSHQDQVLLQKDLSSLQTWSTTWGMNFNPSKCNVLRTRVGQRGEINYFYTLHDQILAEVDTVKYLGVWISNDLSWTPHVDYVTKKGNQKLGFLRRNLRGAPTPSKSLAYTSLVRSGLEYAAPIWDPYKIKDTNKIEAIQRKAARWAKSAYSPHTSVTGLLQDLGWSGLGDRRMILRLTLLYKIYFHQVGIEHTEVGIIPNPRPSRKNSFQILRPRSRKSPYTNSLILRTIPEWNNLPDSTIMAGSASDFKNRFSATQP
ncbi:hypothetical protein EGW08_012836 [Elysia chlorotica]|uniref:Reverse transcriptase domain-containing protein n=1 Tax=Elysia chlorotica TaxID=188477 RepID=A0A433TCV1_ELYCH|nr:hypothetical protein EGW08_012836 [Elysia chlorotica]